MVVLFCRKLALGPACQGPGGGLRAANARIFESMKIVLTVWTVLYSSMQRQECLEPALELAISVAT
jgi:hypothetical protein